MLCVAMSSSLNLFFDETLGYTWRKASQDVAKSKGCGMTHMCSIPQWVAKFVHTQDLPNHQHGQAWLSVLNDKETTDKIKQAVDEKESKGSSLQQTSWKWS